MSAMPVESAPLDQRLDALVVANEVRTFKKQRKQAIRGLSDPWSLVATMLRDPEGHEGAFQLAELLVCLPKIGPRALQKRLLKDPAFKGVALSAKIRTLTAKQRESVARSVDRHLVIPERQRVPRVAVLSPGEMRDEAVRLRESEGLSIYNVAKVLGVGRGVVEEILTIRRHELITEARRRRGEIV